MLSHKQMLLNPEAQRLQTESINKANMIEEILVSEHQIHRKTEKEKEKEVLSLHYKNEKLKRQLAENNGRTAGLEAVVKQLKRDSEESRDMFDYASSTVDDLELQNETLTSAIQSLQQEVQAMESSLLMNMGAANSCVGCRDLNSSRCPGPDLCGRTVLYVGGLHKMIPRYKQLVEKHGGQFLHHDGGKEVARHILPKMLTSADVVLCPVDCVSHDACSMVKKICKRYQKPYVMMRSSGLSSLSKSLGDINIIQ